MGFYNDVQTIARTKELTEKVDKAISVAEEAKKEAIGVKRTTVIQTGSGLPYQDSGSNGAGESQGGTNSSGRSIDWVPAPPGVPNKNDPNRQNSGDTKTTSDGNSGTDTIDAPKDNDKSGNTGSNGGGRTPSLDQGDPGNSSVADDINSIIEAMEANGSSPEQIAKEIQKYLQKRSEKGVNEISDVYNGLAGYSPTDGNWTSIAPNSGEYVEVTSAIDKIRAVVGKLGDDVVRINIDGVEPYPSAAESAAAGQGLWSDANTPPVLEGWEFWEAGYWYETETAYATGSFDGATKYLAAKSAAEASVGYVHPTFGYEVTAYRNLTSVGSEISSGTYTVELYLDWPPAGPGGINDGWITYNMNVFKQSCSGIPNVPVCPALAHTEGSWPPIGMWMLTLNKNGGGYSGNKYDSELPLEYQGTGMGKIVLDSVITGEQYSVSIGVNGGTIIANETTPNYFLYFGADRTLKTVAPMAYLPFYSARKE